jgi:hypothetical protein
MMSLGIVIKGPEGLVLAAESRVTLLIPQMNGQQLVNNFDNATKVLSFSGNNNGIGAVTYGLGALGGRTANSYLPEFEAGLGADSPRLPVGQFANSLSGFFMNQWGLSNQQPNNSPDMAFIVGGYDSGDPYGKVFRFFVPGNPVPEELNSSPQFGLTWGGQHEIVDRLIHGFDPKIFDIAATALNLTPLQLQTFANAAANQLQLPMPLDSMALQDCVDLAIFFIRTTITLQRLTVGIRGCGGPIDVAIITRNDGLTFIQRKQVIGETSRSGV